MMKILFQRLEATKKSVKVQADELYDAVGEFKKELINEKQATELFALKKG